MRQVLLLATISLLIPGPRLHPQTGLSAATSGIGRAEVAVVVEAAIQTLASRLTVAALSTDSTPWRIEIPDSTNPAWLDARAGLLRQLRARPVVASDRGYWLLHFEPITIRGDSLIGAYWMEEMDRCTVEPSPAHPDGRFESPTGPSVRVTSTRWKAYWIRPTLVYTGFVDGWCVIVPSPSAPNGPGR